MSKDILFNPIINDLIGIYIYFVYYLMTIIQLSFSSMVEQFWRCLVDSNKLLSLSLTIIYSHKLTQISRTRFLLINYLLSCILFTLTHIEDFKVHHQTVNRYPISVVGSVVECSPATRAARVRFPDDAFSVFFSDLTNVLI